MKDEKDAAKIDSIKKQRMIDFACDMFGPDGIYLLDCIKLNGNSLIATDIATKIVEELYDDAAPTKKNLFDGECKSTAPKNEEIFNNEYSLPPGNEAQPPSPPADET
uniref:Uncharacterized protein n=1 Tax=Panagrolaimus sp. ES5 TaxID=591445 RepID=A0AC34G0Z9_9BILA